MTTGDQTEIHARRELLASLTHALEKRHEVLDAIIEARDRDDAAQTVGRLLDIPTEHVEAVLALQFWRLNRQDRRELQRELEDINSELDWRPAGERRADRLRLRPFTAEPADAQLFRARASEPREDGTTLHPADRIDDELAAGLARIDDESAAWFVVEDPTVPTPEAVGLIIGELTDGDLEVRLWVDPDKRAQGFGTAALKQCRSELAAYFPGVNLVIRTPLRGGAR